MRFRTVLLAAVAATSLSSAGARADVLPDPGWGAAVPVGTCWITSAYFENSTTTRFCFVSEGTATYEGRVSDVPDLLCRGKAAVAIEDGRLNIAERDGTCDQAEHFWTAEVMSCNWNDEGVQTGGPIGCTVDEPNFGRAKLTLSRE
jgi:hypothetical protein